MDGRGTRVGSGWHAAQMQVNTSRDSVTAAVPPFKNVSVSPPPPSTHSLFPCITIAHPHVSIRAPPPPTPSCPFFTLSDTLCFLFLHITNPCTTSMVRVIRAGEGGRDQPLGSERNVQPSWAVTQLAKCARKRLLLP